MRLLDRYLLRELLVPLGYCLSGIMILWIAFSLISDLNKYQENHLGPMDVMELYAVKIPGDLVLILPITLLLASLYSLTNHARHNELTAMRAAGISLGRICVPYLVVGFALSLALLLVNERLVPDSAEQQEEIMKRHLDGKTAASRDVLEASGFVNGRDHRNWSFRRFYLRTEELIGPTLILTDEQGGERRLVADRARRFDGVWNFFGSAVFNPDEIANLPSLAAQLQQPTNAISRFVQDGLSAQTRRLLSAYNDKTSALDQQALKKALAADLIAITQHGLVYDEERFTNVTISPEAEFMLGQKDNWAGQDRMWLNRTLLLDAFPKEFDKIKRAFSVHVAEYPPPGKPNAEPTHPVQTNRLAMPELTETPDQIRRESKFSARLKAGGDISKMTDLPIVEIKEFLALHPNDLTRQQKDSLNTQFHGRLAAPWTCLVVILIAIPFGAASGRRNLFVGVAGSIVIFFVYFVLLKFGLAAGLSGWLPGWLGAWLPNICFTVAGIWMMLRVR